MASPTHQPWLGVNSSIEISASLRTPVVMGMNDLTTPDDSGS